MDFTADEVYVMKRGLEARLEWKLDEDPQCEEVQFLKSALSKLNMVGYKILGERKK